MKEGNTVCTPEEGTIGYRPLYVSGSVETSDGKVYITFEIEKKFGKQEVRIELDKQSLKEALV